MGTITCSWDVQKNATVCKNVGVAVCPVAGPDVTMPVGCIPFKKGMNSGGSGTKPKKPAANTS